MGSVRAAGVRDHHGRGAASVTLLELEHVSRRHGRGAHERIALDDVSLAIETGELVAVWGMRRSGRSTLLRIAAGLEAPDEGVVRFQGRDPAGYGGEGPRGGVRYCRKTFRPADGRLVLDQLITGQLTHGVSLPVARSRARDTLKRAGAERYAALRPDELNGAEATRVVIARALAHRPGLLVIDEPTLGVTLLERDQILVLLRSIANEGVAVLMSVGETPCLSGSDRALALDRGQLRGEQTHEEPQLAPVIPLRPAARRAATA